MQETQTYIPSFARSILEKHKSGFMLTPGGRIREHGRLGQRASFPTQLIRCSCIFVCKLNTHSSSLFFY